MNTLPPVPGGIFASDASGYDTVYGKGETRFIVKARAQGVSRLADGLGMAIEPAADSVLLWRGIEPPTESASSALRKSG
jgi:shikimate dehydrogenase